VDFDGTEYLDGRTDVVGAIHSFGQELRVSGTAGPDDRLNFMLGGNYQHDRTHDNQLIVFDGTNTGLFNGTPLVYRYAGSGLDNQSNQKITTEAAFGSLDYKLTRTLTAQVSARYTKDKRIFDGCLRDLGDGIFGAGFGLLSNVLHGIPTIPGPGSPSYIPPGGCATFEGNPSSPNYNYPVDNVHAELPEHNISWRGGLSWKPFDESMLYANVTRGFKSGSFGTLPYLTNVQVQPIEQEQLTAYEIGFKSSYWERKVELDAAAFHYDYKNKQLLGYLYTGAIFGNLPGEVSIPKSRVNGAELSVSLRPFTGLTLNVAATVVDSKVTADYRTASPDALYGFQPSHDPSCPPGSTIGSCGVNIKGSPFTYTPKWNLLTDAQYVFPVTSNWNAFVGGNISYRSSTLAAFAGPPDSTPRSEAYTTAGDYELPAYALLDLRLGLESGDGKYRVQLWGHNVMDRYYWLHVVKIQDTLARVTGMPATFGITLSARY
jgi:iron complex outermembrane receptor protein